MYLLVFRVTNLLPFLVAAVALQRASARSLGLGSVAFVSTPELSSPSPSHFALFAKKAAPKGASKKVQVKLLKTVPGTGQKGDVVNVTPAFFQNKLRASKSAEIISDDKVQEERQEMAAAAQAERVKATDLKTTLAETTIRIERKAGPDGQLFGGVGPKLIMEELQKQLNDKEFMAGKRVKITKMTDGEGKKLSSDIKHAGEFGARISLTKDISADFKILIQAEQE